ncbi:MAG: hypothetical protein ACLP7F_03880 [Acidimicrobiales bacterium]|jgi:hypothetical protein
MEMALVSSAVGGEDQGVEALRGLVAVRAHLKDGNELHIQLLKDIDQVLAIVDGDSPPGIGQLPRPTT